MTSYILSNCFWCKICFNCSEKDDSVVTDYDQDRIKCQPWTIIDNCTCHQISATIPINHLIKRIKIYQILILQNRGPRGDRQILGWSYFFECFHGHSIILDGEELTIEILMERKCKTQHVDTECFTDISKVSWGRHKKSSRKSENGIIYLTPLLKEGKIKE